MRPDASDQTPPDSSRQDKTRQKEKPRPWQGILSALRDHSAPVGRLDWRATQIRVASVSVVAVALSLGGGFLFGAPQAGMAATTGALSTGFGAFHRLANAPGLPMLLAAVGMGFCAFLGAALGHSSLASACAGGLVGGACGFATRFGQASWWLTLQWSVAFFLATAMPSSLSSAAERGGLVLAGGLLQLGIIGLGSRWDLKGDGRPSAGGFFRLLRQTLASTLRSGIASASHLRYAIVAGLMTSTAILIERSLALPNGYWVPMTALIILKPQMHDTTQRTVQRIAGTLAGGGATLLAALIRPAGITLALIVILLAWCSYAFQRVNYAVFSFGITATVVFLLSITGPPEPITTVHRVLATFIGALLALIAGASTGDHAGQSSN